MITAGGQGSVQSALASGVPLIGMPLQPEQDATVAFAARQGAARLVSQSRVPDPELARTAREMLADSRYRDHARRLQAIFARVDGPNEAGDAILALIEPRGRPRMRRIREHHRAPSALRLN